MSYIASLKERVQKAEAEAAYSKAEAEYYKSLVDTFFTGHCPEITSIKHLQLAKWGRKRLAELQNKPKLLQASDD